MRRLLVTGLGLLYLNAFVIFWNQGVGLLGSRGLAPLANFLPAVLEHFGGAPRAWMNLPTLFFLNSSDLMIQAVAALGIVLSVPLILGFANFPLLLSLWMLQISIVHAGQIFWSFGWETQLLEFTFLSIFLCPLWNPRLDRPESPPKKIAIYFQRWMLFRLMLGAGLIKLRGDPCWQDLSCTLFHYETQPNPHFLSWYWHQLPIPFHQGEVVFNHLVEVVLPFAVFGPTWVRRVAGVWMMVFQVSLILSGNLAWLNWLTLLMVLPCFDDQFLLSFTKWPTALLSSGFRWSELRALPPSRLTQITLGLFLVVGLWLSWEPAKNLFAQQQKMNASFNSLHLINSYGAFGSISKVRNEIIISGTDSVELGPHTIWKEYEFKCKPGHPSKRPCWITPYHLHLDWQMWFSAMEEKISEQWLGTLALRLLEGEKTVTHLLAENPFADHPPRHLKMDLYRYEFVTPNDPNWWKRTYLHPYLEPVSLQISD